jgi:alanine racemase
VRRWIELSLRALDENAERARSTTPIADLRADAYGHDLRVVAERLERHGFDAFLVSPGADPGPVRTPVITTTAGIDPSALSREELFGIRRGFTPVLRAGAEVLAVKRIAAGEGVSYGHTWAAPSDTELALVGAGYAHGIVRRASNAAQVAVNGAPCTIVGVRLVSGGSSGSPNSVRMVSVDPGSAYASSSRTTVSARSFQPSSRAWLGSS